MSTCGNCSFILNIAVHMPSAAPERGHPLASSPTVVLGYLALGVLTGIASGLFGIGGAIVAIPILASVFVIGDLVAKGTPCW